MKEKILNKKWIGIIIGIIFLYLTFRNFKYDEFIRSIKDFNFFYLFPIIFILFSSYIIRGFRWKIILDNLKRISLYNSFSVILIGQMANNLLPARLGDVIRAYVIGSRENISKSASFASIIFERVLDGVVLIILISGVCYFLLLPLLIKKMILISTLLFGLALIFLFIFAYKMGKIIELIKKIVPTKNGNPDKLSSFLLKFTSGLDILKNRKQLTIVLIFTFFVWSCEALIYYMLFKALDIQVPFYSSIFVLGIANLAISIPSLPGNIGIFHYATILALAVFEVSKNTGLVYAITLHGIEYILLVVSGLFFMSIFGLEIRNFRTYQKNKHNKF